MIGVVQVNVTQTSKKDESEEEKKRIRKEGSVPTSLFEIFGS